MIQFPTENYAPQDADLQLLYSPLNAYLGGQQTAKIQQLQEKALQDAQEVLRQRQLENVGREREAAQAQLEMQMPGFLEQMARGKAGTAQTQEMAGLTARQTQPYAAQEKISGVVKTLSENQWSQITDLASNATVQLQNTQDPIQRAAMADQLFNTPEGQALTTTLGLRKQDLVAPGSESKIVDAIRTGSAIRGMTPQSMGTERVGVAKMEAKAPGGFTPANAIAIGNLASSLGISYQEAADMITAGLGKLKGTQPQPPAPQQGRIGFPTTQQPSMQISPEVQLERDKEALRLIEEEARLNPDDPALKRDLENARSRVQQASKGVDLSKPLNRMGVGQVRERTYNLTENFGQATKELSNISNAPAGSVLNALAGVTGKSGDDLYESIRNSLARQATKEDKRVMQQLVSGLELAMANVIGGGYASSATKGRMEMYKEQMAQAGDSPKAMAIFLARMKQELQIAGENFEDRPGATDSQKERVKKYMAELERVIPYSVDDINEATVQRKGKGTMREEVGRKVPGARASLVGDKVIVGGKSYTRPSDFTDEQWKKYKKDMGVE